VAKERFEGDLREGARLVEIRGDASDLGEQLAQIEPWNPFLSGHLLASVTVT
jgi:hypothetical protein